MSHNSLLYVDSLPASDFPIIAYRARISKFCIDFAEIYDKSFYFMRLRPRTALRTFLDTKQCGVEGGPFAQDRDVHSLECHVHRGRIIEEVCGWKRTCQVIHIINITDGSLLIAQGAAAQFGFQEQVLAMWTLSVIAREVPWWAALASWSKKLRGILQLVALDALFTV
ncbi:hypothetical transcript [Echinococcus multilocularis]|uniref:Hypothetical transcript n=1 Tax=Echinococcus multilocularis TaxID=6211 RepID=A0A068XUW6_ECHMU|nr:hypothetical transcript [Echinococcus multilocularis]